MGLSKCIDQRQASSGSPSQPFPARAGYCADYEDGELENFVEMHVSSGTLPSAQRSEHRGNERPTAMI